MKKKEIKKTLEKMQINQTVVFFSDSNGVRQDRVRKEGQKEFNVYSQGQGWQDQAADQANLSQTLKWMWAERPHSYDCHF